MLKDYRNNFLVVLALLFIATRITGTSLMYLMEKEMRLEIIFLVPVHLLFVIGIIIYNNKKLKSIERKYEQ